MGNTEAEHIGDSISIHMSLLSDKDLNEEHSILSKLKRKAEI
jgi:hypothetical protein